MEISFFSPLVIGITIGALVFLAIIIKVASLKPFNGKCPACHETLSGYDQRHRTWIEKLIITPFAGAPTKSYRCSNHHKFLFRVEKGTSSKNKSSCSIVNI